MWQDQVNGLFELLGGLFISLTCIKLYKDKKVRGLSFVHIAYFTMWGYWNIHYYPHLGQWVRSTPSAKPITSWILFSHSNQSIRCPTAAS